MNKEKEFKIEDIFTPMSVFDQLSDEEILYWSSPYYDELQRRKEEHKRKLEEEKNG